MKAFRAGLAIGLFAALSGAGFAAAQEAQNPAVIILDVDEDGVLGAETPGPETAVGPVTFDAPLAGGVEEIRGKTISEVFTDGSPLFAPIEGLPEEVWKDQPCTSCHEWNRERICEQATNYLDPAFTDNLTKPHPLGGSFKENLRLWAEGGCS